MAEVPTWENLFVLLQKCRQRKNPCDAMLLHAFMCEHQLETDATLGNHLVPLLVDCGCVPHAHYVFNRLPYRNQYSWGSLISGYIDCTDQPQAFLLYSRMQEDSMQPSTYTYVALLKACVTLNNVEGGRDLHRDIIFKGLEKELFVGGTLVDMHRRFGMLPDAHHVIDHLPVRDVVSWTALMTGYADCGSGDEVLDCFEKMQLEGILPDVNAFACSLKACGIVCALQTGQVMHIEIAKRGFERELFVGTTLVDMYAKCNSLSEAQQMFDQLPNRNVVSWTALIAGCAENGLGAQALNFFEEMQAVGILPDANTFVCMMKACGIIGALRRGQELHSEVIKMGLERGDLYIGHMLVDMYAKCGLLGDAQDLFDKICIRPAVLWDAIIAGYAEHGFGEGALRCYKQMQSEGIFVSIATFTCSLKACGIIGASDTGQEIHVEITKKAMERELYMSTTLVDMYAKCGMLAEAEELFHRLPIRNVVAWTALIAAYAEYGLADEALSCFQQMQLQGVFPDGNTFICSLKACGIVGALKTGEEIHAEIFKRGLERELYVNHTLVNMYIKCAALAEARNVFIKQRYRDAISWNALIAGYVEHDFGEEALEAFKQMQSENFSPITVTFTCTLKACGIACALGTGREIHTLVTKMGFEENVFVGHMLVEMYGKCGSFVEGREVFDKLPVRDVVSWTAMIKGYGKNHEAIMALQCFEEMEKQGVKPDPITFTCLLAACSHGSLLVKGQKLFKVMKEAHEIEPSMDHYACMINLFARSGRVNDAERFTKVMQCLPSQEILRALLTACKVYGRVELGLKCFQQLVKLDQEDATAYLLMADIYASAGRWSDVSKLEVLRKHLGANKKPASASIEMKNEHQDFTVGDDQRKDITDMLNTIYSRMKKKGYVPNVCVIIKDLNDKEKVTYLELTNEGDETSEEIEDAYLYG